ncbi:hypothetical protein OROGR_016473 [Orobanche gracilis]
MPELAGFQDSRSAFRARDLSPDSVIFTAESSNFSIFSSASASVDRCSFASDVPDQDFVASVVSRNLAGHELSEVLIGPDPDPNKPTLVHKNSISLSRREKTKVQKIESSEAETTEDESIVTGSGRNSFSLALKECQVRRFRSEITSKKSDPRRQASLDLNNSLNSATNSPSPRLEIMNKRSYASRKTTGIFPSPGTPNYRQTNIGPQKGWSSERVPLHTNANRQNLNTPLLQSGRTLPSKWEDAERWIFSPMSGDGGGLRTSSIQQAQRRPKSKSGPLGPPGVAYYQMFSPAEPMFEGGGHNGKLIGNSPFPAGVVTADGLSVGYGGFEGDTGNFDTSTEPCMARSVSIHGCSEMLCQSLLLGHHSDEKCEDGANNISLAVSRRDMATQMSPESSSQSSPINHSPSFSLTTSTIQHVVESQNMHSNKPEIRDVPVDERVTMTRCPRNNKCKINLAKGSRNGGDWKREDVNFQPGSWEVVPETPKSFSMIQSEQGKVTAWENLQKAKAEAAIRKLEMKLEKKRSSSMEKIMNKLRSAQKKAQEMRSSVMTNRDNNQIARPSDRALPFRRLRPIGSLSGWFTCHVFQCNS